MNLSAVSGITSAIPRSSFEWYEPELLISPRSQETRRTRCGHLFSPDSKVSSVLSAALEATTHYSALSSRDLLFPSLYQPLYPGAGSRSHQLHLSFQRRIEAVHCNGAFLLSGSALFAQGARGGYPGKGESMKRAEAMQTKGTEPVPVMYSAANASPIPDAYEAALDIREGEPCRSTVHDRGLSRMSYSSKGYLTTPEERGGGSAVLGERCFNKYYDEGEPVTHEGQWSNKPDLLPSSAALCFPARRRAVDRPAPLIQKDLREYSGEGSAKAWIDRCVQRAELKVAQSLGRELSSELVGARWLSRHIARLQLEPGRPDSIEDRCCRICLSILRESTLFPKPAVLPA